MGCKLHGNHENLGIGSFDGWRTRYGSAWRMFPDWGNAGHHQWIWHFIPLNVFCNRTYAVGANVCEGSLRAFVHLFWCGGDTHGNGSQKTDSFILVPFGCQRFSAYNRS